MSGQLKNAHYFYGNSAPRYCIFQSTMSSLLGDLSFAHVFQDDIVVFSNSYEEHFDHLTEVLSRLNWGKTDHKQR